MSNTELANLFAKHFIARRDVRAEQHRNGAYTPIHENWRRQDLLDHIEGRRTYGHYLVNTDDTCKLFAFDIDLNKFGQYAVVENGEELFYGVEDLRASWLQRNHPGRSYWKYQFKTITHLLVRAIHDELKVRTIAAYSGGKGVHVYGLTGPLPAEDVREAAHIVLDTVGGFRLLKGEHFFEHTDFPNFSIEVYPKQNSLKGKDLGNLMRLPLGRNLKSKDPTFFLDMTAGMSDFVALDPLYALSDTYNPWKRPCE